MRRPSTRFPKITLFRLLSRPDGGVDGQKVNRLLKELAFYYLEQHYTYLRKAKENPGQVNFYTAMAEEAMSKSRRLNEAA